MAKLPLVSIVVITYNSGKYVLETLESIKSLTYSNIEIIVTDDGSTDDTLELCREWQKTNRKNFSNCETLEAVRNTGIPGNCNRGVNASKGKWIKIIAGDDLLMPDSIENFFKFIDKNPAAEVIYSNSIGFEGSNPHQNLGTYDFPGYRRFFDSDVAIQYKMLLRRNYCDGPTVFFTKDVFNKVGGFNEIFKFEDHPFGLKLTKNSIRLYYMNHYTVNSRQNIASITRVKDHRLFSSFYKEVEKFNRAKIYPNCNIFVKLGKKMDYYRFKILDKAGLNRNTIFSKFLFRASYYINPLHIFNKYY